MVDATLIGGVISPNENRYMINIDRYYFDTKSSYYFYTVNVDIFAQLNFRASSPMEYIRVFLFSRICQLVLFVLL